MKKRLILCMVIVCLVITESMTMEVKAKAQTTSEAEQMITVDGNVRAVITSDSSKRSDYPGSRVMNLEGQIVNIRFKGMSAARLCRLFHPLELRW